MSGILRWYYSVDSMTVLEITDRVNWPEIEIGGKANQDAWEGDLLVDDPDGDFLPLMFRRIYCNDDDAPSGAQVVGNWFISNLKVQRMNPKVLTSRRWVITMADENSLLSRRIFVGSDSNRPAETDIERLRWALTTTELNVLDPNEDYIDTTGPVDLDAADLRQQGPDEMMASLMAASGKQYWVIYREDLTPHVYTLWYANQNRSDLYSSTVSLSNVLSEVGDPTSTLVYPLSSDAELDRAGGRMASGLVAPFKTAWIYLQDTDVGDTYAYVDRVAGDFKNVSSLTKATAQVTRELHELALPDDEITTTWTVESDNLNLIKQGMRVPVHASHFPNYTDDSDVYLPGYLQPGYSAGFVWCRVMERTVRQVGQTTFEVPLRLSPQKLIPCEDFELALTPAGYYPPLGHDSGIGDDGYTIYGRAGGLFPLVPTPDYTAGSPWHFPEYMTADAGATNPAGWTDGILGTLGNSVRILLVGVGTCTVHTRVQPRGPDGLFQWFLRHEDAGTVDDANGDDVEPGGATVIEVPDDGFCVHWIDLVESTTRAGGTDPAANGCDYDGFDWAPV